jgi:hypothetical protein
MSTDCVVLPWTKKIIDGHKKAHVFVGFWTLLDALKQCSGGSTATILEAVCADISVLAPILAPIGWKL